MAHTDIRFKPSPAFQQQLTELLGAMSYDRASDVIKHAISELHQRHCLAPKWEAEKTRAVNALKVKRPRLGARRSDIDAIAYIDGGQNVVVKTSLGEKTVFSLSEWENVAS